MDNEPRRAPPVKYAKRITCSTYARLLIAEGRKVPRHGQLQSSRYKVYDVPIDTSIGRPYDVGVTEGCVFPHADSTVI